jgi:hypothetical protein
MKPIILMLLIYSFTSFSNDFTLKLNEKTITELPPIQSFVVSQNNNDWLIIGGRTDGLHKRQPFASFVPENNNTKIYVINPDNENVYAKEISFTNSNLNEQLQSTNMEFIQIDNMLYIFGGYAYSPTEQDHITYPYLTVVNVPEAIDAIKNNKEIDDYFTQIYDERIRVTGGYAGFLNDTFYIVGGQNFEGRYNPMGPDHGPGFEQEYTNSIKKFTIENNNGDYSIENYSEIIDEENLHRRDYNLVPQVFPNGERGFTAFTGVFQHTEDIPWLNTVDITDSGYDVNNDFNQFLNQYHTAHTPIFDSQNNRMHTIFFGGIGRYFIDENGIMQDDTNVPFVNTISMVTRNSDGTMTEEKIGEMPDLIGASAEFIPHPDIDLFHNEIIDFNQIVDSALVGYIFGGIKSNAPNVFFDNTTNSFASSKVYEVYLVKNTTSVKNPSINPTSYFNLKILDNPVHNQLSFSFNTHKSEDVQISVYDLTGKLIYSEQNNYGISSNIKTIELNSLSSGTYFLELKNNQFKISEKFILE